MAGGFRCANCDGLRLAFEFARPAMRRDEQLLEIVHRLKYRREIHLARDLGRLLVEAFDDPRLADARSAGWPLVPVPLHRSRLRWRHFNQASEIARAAAGELGLPVLEVLKRVRKTATQTVLGRKRRLQNLKRAFAVTRRGRHWLTTKPTGVVLVDDVLTTGSTAHACAQVLRQAGVPRVVVVTVMRG